MKLTLKKLRNVRDISYGGIKEHRLIRGEALSRIPKSTMKELRDTYNLKVVIDLRTTQEHDDKPDKVIDGVTYYHLPLVAMEEMGTSSEKEGKAKVLKDHKLPDIYEYYRNMVIPKRKETWTKIFDILLDTKEGSIYFHCTVGKDRSGLASAIILSALGIDKETIYKDYLLTNEDKIIPFSYRLFSYLMDKEFRKEFMEYFKAKESYLDESFRYIDEQYGGMETFLKDICGLTKEKREKLRELYLR